MICVRSRRDPDTSGHPYRQLVEVTIAIGAVAWSSLVRPAHAAPPERGELASQIAVAQPQAPATPSSAANPDVPPGGSDLPERLSDGQLIEAIVGRTTEPRACAQQQALGSEGDEPLILRWTILPDGSVRGMRSLSQELADRPAAACIMGIVQGIRFPRSRLGHEVEAFPFLLSRAREAAKQPGGKAAPAADAAAPSIPTSCKAVLDSKLRGWRLAPVTENVSAWASHERFNPVIGFGDFDGDGRNDAAILVQHAGQVKVAVCLAAAGGTRFRVIERPYCSDYLFISKAGGEHYNFETEKTEVIKNDGISVACFEKAGATYLYDGRGFRKLVDSD